MSRIDIAEKCYTILEKKWYGLSTSELVKELKEESSNDDTKYFRNIRKIREKDSRFTGFKKGKKTINCLSKNEIDAKIHHGIGNKKHISELERIECGFLLIEKGVFTQKKGGLVPYLDRYNFDKKIRYRGILDNFRNSDDNSDFLYFWVSNGNYHTIRELIARIYVSPYFFNPLNPKHSDCKKCDYSIDDYNINIYCEKLFPNETGMPDYKAEILIPLERKREDTGSDEDRHEMMPNVSVIYQELKVKNVKGAELKKDISKGQPILLIE